jgi:chromatin structure-remodeling complex subunit RSC9
MERGDKYRFESFAGLAEALIEKLLEVSSLFYQVDWQISYTEDGTMFSSNTLDGAEGTPNILERIAQLSKLEVDDNIQPAEFSDALLQVIEAALTMRNMVMLEENAQYVSEMAPLRDFLSIALNLPKLESVIELKHYALDIAEQLTRYLHFEENDPLYVSLLAQLQSEDRGAILTSLRAIGRISMDLEENNLLRGVPKAAVQNIMDWTILNDEEMVHACLDFLYQYTAVVDNVDFLITNIQVEPLVNQLTRLLTHGAKDVIKEYPRGVGEVREPAPDDLAPLPRELLTQLLRLEEPERSSQWLRCLFEEDSHQAITQIKLWAAYQECFVPTVQETGRSILPAADFIKNVSSTFVDKATAQVQHRPGEEQKFVIKGIRMRSVPVDLQGEPYHRCLWNVHFSGAIGPCGEFFMSPNEMFRHIMQVHLRASPLADGKFANQENNYACYWDKCHRFQEQPTRRLAHLASHIKLHLPTTQSAKPTSSAGPPSAKRTKPSYTIPGVRQPFHWQQTAADEQHQAAGIPLSAVLVLRNLARNLSKTDAEQNAVKVGKVSYVHNLFKPVEPRLYEVMAHNKALVRYILYSLPLRLIYEQTGYMTDLLASVNAG